MANRREDSNRLGHPSVRDIHDALGKVPMQALASGTTIVSAKVRRERPVTKVERPSGLYPDSPAEHMADRRRREKLYSSVLACIRAQVFEV